MNRNDLGPEHTGHQLALYLYECVEPLVWQLGNHDLEHRLYAGRLAEWWTAERARPILVDRAGGCCECPCREPFGTERGDTHHGLARARYRGPYRHHPVNLFLVRTCCLDAVTGVDGSAIDREREAYFENLAEKRLPAWFNDPIKPCSQPGKNRESYLNPLMVYRFDPHDDVVEYRVWAFVTLEEAERFADRVELEGFYVGPGQLCQRNPVVSPAPEGHPFAGSYGYLVESERYWDV